MDGGLTSVWIFAMLPTTDDGTRIQLTIERAEFDRLIFAIHKVLNTT